MNTISYISVGLNVIFIILSFYTYKRYSTYIKGRDYDSLKADRDALFNENFTLKTKINYKKQNIDYQIKREIEREKALKKINSIRT